MQPSDNVVEAAKGIKNTKLREAAENFLEMVSQVGEGLEGEMHYQPPFLRMVQGTTDSTSIPQGCSSGDLVIGSAPHAEKMPKPLPFYMLMIHNGRSYFHSADDGSGKLLCFSPDGIVGKMGTCKDCQFSQRVSEEKGSPCSANRTMYGLTEELDLIFKYVFAKTGYQESSKISKYLRAPRGVKNTFDMPWELSSSPYPAKKNVFVPVLVPRSEDVPDDIKAFLKALSQQIKEDHAAYVTMFRENLVSSDALQLENNPGAPIDVNALPVGGKEELTFDV